VRLRVPEAAGDEGPARSYHGLVFSVAPVRAAWGNFCRHKKRTATSCFFFLNRYFDLWMAVVGNYTGRNRI
jgi:hypothetical protein